MKRSFRRLKRWILWPFLCLLVICCSYIAILFFPAPLFAHGEDHGRYRIYSDEPIPQDFGRVIEEIDWRLEGMEHPPPEADQRIYLCGPKKYAFFALLTRRSPETLAIGLSLADETFVSVDRVRLFAATNRGRLRHTRFEGDLAEVVAHEIAHFNSARALGYRAHLRLPLWKSEGWAEYQANLAAIRADPGYDLRRRIEILLDDGFWGGRHGLARYLWESQLLVEFLGEVEGYSLEELARDDVTESSTRERMMAWHRETAAPASEHGSTPRPATRLRPERPGAGTPSRGFGN